MKAARQQRKEPGLLPAYPNPGIKIDGAGDFDGDNDTDILWRNNWTGKNLLWFMDGTSLAPVAALLPSVPNSSWNMVETGD